MDRIYNEWKTRAAFLMVYIREAHPSDEWQMSSNVDEKVVFAQPTSEGSRNAVAGECCSRLKVSMPCVVDSLDNAVDGAYAAFPERLFVIDAAGKIAYAGQQGPWGYQPEHVEEWLKRNC